MKESGEVEEKYVLRVAPRQDIPIKKSTYIDLKKSALQQQWVLIREMTGNNSGVVTAYIALGRHDRDIFDDMESEALATGVIADAIN